MQKVALFAHSWHAKPVALCLAWVLGTAIQLQQAALWPASWYALLMLLALLLGLWPWHKRVGRGGRLWQAPAVAWPVAAWLLCAALAFAVTGLRACHYTRSALDPALEGQDLRITGVVGDMPQLSEAGLRFLLLSESAQQAGRLVAVPRRIDVAWYADSLNPRQQALALPLPQVQAGERWSLTLRLKAPHGSSNPFGFDWELWLWERGVQATAYVRSGVGDAAPQRQKQTWQQPVAWLRQQVRDRILAQVQPRAVAGLMAALVVGDQAAIDRADWEVFRATGVAHLVSISGLHITMFAWAAAWLLRQLWKRSARLCLWLPAPHAALLGGVALASAYALFSGWGLPAQRTCVMLASVALLRGLGLHWPWPAIWMLACAVVVAFDPWALLQAGFWLSFVAVGVLFATQGNSHRSPDSPSTKALASPAGPVQRVRHFAAFAQQQLWALLREQWVISLALAPLSLLLFGQISLVGLLANALAIPWVTLLLTPLSLLGLFLPGLWGMAAGAAGWFIQGLQVLAAWPGATLALAQAPWWMAAFGVGGGLLLAAPLPASLRVLGLPLLLPVLLWQAPTPPPGEFALLAADVGQGNAVLVRTARHALLYDAGPRYSLESDAGQRVLLPLLQALQLRLDLVVLSHRDTDHVGGAAAVLHQQAQARLLSSMHSDETLAASHAAARCEAGQHWLWDGVRFEILHPLASDYALAQSPNARSCVLRIQSAAGPAGPSRVALLAGDIEAAQEAQLLARDAPVRADLLLVPHHGSKTSSTAAFLDAVLPQEAWVQSGYRNRYGHPAAEVLQRYQERHILVHDSPHCGAMRWQTNGQDAGQAWGVCHRTEAMHYWNHQVP